MENSDKKKRHDAIMNRKLILEVADSLFQTYSVSEVTMKQIAVECNIGQGTLYRHFSNKAEICQNLMDHKIETMFNVIDEIKHSNKTDEDKIRYILYTFVRLINDNKQKLEEMKRTGKRSSVMMNLHFYDRLKADIQACIDNLEIVSNAEFHTDIMLNAFSRDVFDYYCVEKKVTPEQFADRIHFVFIERLMR